MGLFQKISDVLSGGLLKDAGDLIDRFVTTKKEKEEMKQQMTELVQKQEAEIEKLSLRAQQEFDQRVRDLEGTAKDLNQAGWIGRVVLFLRGAQRPMWGYFVGFMDFMVFSGKWHIAQGSQLQSAFWVINFLVLGFLFGERAVRNVAPLVRQMTAKKAVQEPDATLIKG